MCDLFNTSFLCWFNEPEKKCNYQKLQNRRGRNHSHTQRKVNVTELSTKINIVIYRIVNLWVFTRSSHSSPPELPPSGKEESTHPVWSWASSERSLKKTLKAWLHINYIYGCLPLACSSCPYALPHSLQPDALTAPMVLN